MTTKKKLHAAKRRAEREAKAEAKASDSGFRERHEREMQKMLRGVDHERFERLANGG